MLDYIFNKTTLKKPKSLGLSTFTQDLFLSRLNTKDAKDLESSFARVFSTEDGKRILGYLHAMVFERTSSATTEDSVLRYQEGQRAFLALILRLIDRGKGIR